MVDQIIKLRIMALLIPYNPANRLIMPYDVEKIEKFVKVLL